MLVILLSLLSLQGSLGAETTRPPNASQIKAASETAAAAADNPFQLLLPPWAAVRSADLALNFSAADAAAQRSEAGPITFRGQPIASVTLRKGYFYGNLAVVRFGGTYITAVRKIQFYITPRSSVPEYPTDADPKKKWISWWTNRISLCTADPASLQPQACIDFDPRNWTECMWNGGFETLGPEDPRLIIWPSKGLFMMFNSKPWPVNPGGTKPQDTQCAGPWAQQPWLVPLVTYDGAAAKLGVAGPVSTPQQQQQQQQGDPWTQGLIRLQYLPPELQGDPQAVQAMLKAVHKASQGPFLHKQKNWNPFIYKDELYFSQSFLPHVVLKPEPGGMCHMVHMTDGLAFKTLPAKPRGNTQAVLVPAAVSGLAADVYIGIVHTEVDRKYENYFYQMEAQPPFAITAVSAGLPLIPGQHPRVPTWGHISFPMSLQLLGDTKQLLIGYGSGDQTPRIKLMPLEEALALFSSSSSSSSDGSSSGRGDDSSSSKVQHHRRPDAAGSATAGGAGGGATDVGVGSKVAAKLSASTTRGQSAGQAAVAAVEEAMGLRPAANTGGTTG